MTLRVATRGSALARAQAALAIGALAIDDYELVVVTTPGDRKPDAKIEELSGQGWFTSDVEVALLEGRADIAVHSGKDLPLKLADGLVVAAYLPRADCRDALVTRDGITLEALPDGCTVGTSSARRAAWLAELRPELQPVAIRGNVDTRLRKLESGEVDALILAAAGLDRLELGHRASQRLDPEQFLPAPAQGAIAIETAGSGVVFEQVRAIDDPVTSAAVVAERAVLEGLGGGCTLALGAYATVSGELLRLRGAFARGGENGEKGEIKRAEVSGDLKAPIVLGHQLAARLQ